MNSFEVEAQKRLLSNGENERLQRAARDFMRESIDARYSYNFLASGCPVIQYPQDMVALQELIWKVRPDLVIETGIARGGSLILSASCLALLDYCDAVAAGELLDPSKPKRRVLGVDIDIREHGRKAVEAHPMSRRIDMIEGSSVAPYVIARVKAAAAGKAAVLVLLDSNHTHEHVLGELNAYADLVTVGSYCVVFDTVIEDLPADSFPDRPWGRGNNAKTAVHAFLAANKNFEIDKFVQNKLLITVAPDGYLKRVR